MRQPFRATLGFVKIRLVASCLACVAACAAPDHVEGPPHRLYAAMAYDSTRAETVLVGGAWDDGTGLLGYRRDLWVWDGELWSERPYGSTRLSDRRRHGMAYDASRDRVVLFGGTDFSDEVFPQDLDDTWTWDGESWTEIEPAVRPPAQAGHVLAADPANDRVLLLGVGVWAWDGAIWSELTPGTAARGRPMGFHAARGEGVQVGSSGETWIWTEVAGWTEATSVPALPDGARGEMVYDAGRETIVMFGGERAETWEWDGATWTERTPPGSPPPRTGHSLAYDEARARVVLHGGDQREDTWEWDGVSWERR